MLDRLATTVHDSRAPLGAAARAVLIALELIPAGTPRA